MAPPRGAGHGLVFVVACVYSCHQILLAQSFPCVNSYFFVFPHVLVFSINCFILLVIYISSSAFSPSTFSSPHLQDGQTALHVVVQKNKPDVVGLLLERGADPSALDKVREGGRVFRCCFSFFFSFPPSLRLHV